MFKTSKSLFKRIPTHAKKDPGDKVEDLIVHQVNISHYRLVELSKLADQIKPFYDWVEKSAKRITGSHRSLHEILMSCSKDQVKEIIVTCYLDSVTDKPLLFDGIGRVYAHPKACFYFFAWMIRDAPQQRLSPLIARMRRIDNVSEFVSQTDTLVELIFEYRSIVKSFEWLTVREVILDRLEGSRRSIRGHTLEANVRAGLITAVQNYYAIYGNYGVFEQINIADGQIKVKNHSVDVSAELLLKRSNEKVYLLIPIKTRETEGGGHAHLFTRDVTVAIRDIKEMLQPCYIIVVIIAENWSVLEVQNIENQIDLIFHFNISPNKFGGFDESSQIQLNRFVERILSGYGQ